METLLQFAREKKARIIHLNHPPLTSSLEYRQDGTYHIILRRDPTGIRSEILLSYQLGRILDFETYSTKMGFDEWEALPPRDKEVTAWKNAIDLLAKYTFPTWSMVIEEMKGSLASHFYTNEETTAAIDEVMEHLRKTLPKIIENL